MPNLITTLQADNEQFELSTNNFGKVTVSAGADIQTLNPWGSVDDPFELSYLLRFRAVDQLVANGGPLVVPRALVGPGPLIVSGTILKSDTAFGGSPGLVFPSSPFGTIRQALPSIFSPEKPFALFYYTTMGATNTVKYLTGFGDSDGNPRLALFFNPAAPGLVSFVALSTAQDVVPINEISRVGGNLYQGRRLVQTERALIGLGYDGTSWFGFWNGQRMALSIGYGFTARTAGAITTDGYLYFNGMASLAYGSDPILSEYSLINHCPTDDEIAQHWRSLAIPGEKCVYALGTSITFGSGTTTDAVTGTLNGWPQQLQDLSATRVVMNLGKVTDTSADILARLNTAIRYILPKNRPNSVMTIEASTNDLISTSQTAAEIYARLVTIANNARQYGIAKTIMATVLPSTGITGGRETQRLALNAAILQYAGVNCTAVSDVASRPNLLNPSNATYYSDGTHLTDAGAVEYATATEATLVSIGA